MDGNYTSINDAIDRAIYDMGTDAQTFDEPALHNGLGTERQP
jgi:hypothetical protein